MKDLTGYLGPDGSYSQLAAKILRPDDNLVAYGSFPKLFSALRRGELGAIVLPIENTLNGGVIQNIDLLQDADNAVAVKECYVVIDHRLITKKGADISRITRIFSHGQALGQCAKFIAENMPDAEISEVSSTSESVKFIRTERDAAIAGSHMDVGELVKSEKSVSDESNNFTQFLLVVRGEIPSAPSEKIFISVTCRHEPGSLVKLLGVLKEYNINMTKIESRPIKERVGEYRFFIEMEADYASDKVRRALAELKDLSSSLKILGCY